MKLKDKPLLNITVNYDGLDAAKHRMEMFVLGESLQGLAKIFTSAADFSESQTYSKRKLSKKYKVYAYPSRPGSHEILSELYNISVQTGIFSGTVPMVISNLVTWLIARSGQRKEAEHLKQELLNQFKSGLSAKDSHITHMQSQISWLEKRLEAFYEDHHSCCKKLVNPIGRTCDQLRLSYDDHLISLDQGDKILINLNPNESIEEVESLGVVITGTDIRNGTCKVHLDNDPKRRIKATIIDQKTFIKPHDPYSDAMASREEIFVKATKIFHGSKLKEIIIHGLAKKC